MQMKNSHPMPPAIEETSELRGRVRCHLANMTDGQARHHQNRLEQELVLTFGGFSATPLLGGWRDNDKERLVTEPGTTYDVTYSKSAHPNGDMILRDIFLRAAHSIGEKFAYVEFDEVHVLIARVRPDKGEHDTHV